VGRASVIFLASFLLSGPAAGRTDEPRGGSPPVYPPRAAGVDTVHVRSQRPDLADRWRRETPFVSILFIEEAGPSDDAASLLERAAGLQIRRYGSLGAYSTAALRGTSPGQLQVFWDDVPLLTGADPAVNLALVPLAGVDHVELFRSGVPSGLPGTAGPGAVRFVTRDAPASRSAGFATEGNLRAGSYGTFGGHVLQSLDRPTWKAALSAGALRSAGDFTYLDRRGTLENPFDDRETRRRNNDFRQNDLLLRITKSLTTLGTAGDPFTLSISTQRLDREAGVPGPENIQTRDVRDDYTRWIHTVRLASPGVWSGRLQVEANGSVQRIRDRFSNPEAEVGLGRSDTDSRIEQDAFGATATTTWFETGQTLLVMGHLVRERFTPTDLLRDREGYTRTRDAVTLSSEDRIRFFDDRILVAFSYRRVETDDNYTGPPAFGRPPAPYPTHTSRIDGAGAGIRLDLGRRWTMKANRTWTARLPTFFELFGSNGVQDPNPALRAEDGWQADAGILWIRDDPSGPRVSWEVVAFKNVTTDRIALIQNSQRTTKSVNLDGAEVEGVETDFDLSRLRIGPLTASLRAGAALQDARDTGPSPLYDGKEIPFVAPLRGDAGLRIGWGSWSAGYTLSHESAVYRDRFNTKEHRTPDRTLHGLSISRSFWKKRILATVEAANLIDERSVDAEGYPLPGRSWFLGLRWSR
jgi:outer membrane cobalamin receptor